MSEDNHFPDAPYEDGGAVNFSVVYVIAVMLFIASILIFG
jgi:hypothetical protein|tara:strand:+ start:10005 stop:10124 length:120 start_codon:yes stop_codon:yes gene_type:complete